MKNIILSLLIILTGCFSLAQSEGLQKFETDYCTLFVNGTPKHPNLWKHCCFEHDLRYWFGGTLVDRNTADSYLKQCVYNVAGSFWANLIYDGVKIGHKSPVKNRHHWGWGWTPLRENTPLNNSEKVIIRDNLFQLNLSEDYIEQFINKYNLN